MRNMRSSEPEARGLNLPSKAPRSRGTSSSRTGSASSASSAPTSAARAAFQSSPARSSGTQGAPQVGPMPTFGVLKARVGSRTLPKAPASQRDGTGQNRFREALAQEMRNREGGSTGSGGAGKDNRGWNQESESLSGAESLYEDIMGNLREQRDFIVSQGQQATANAGRQAAYVAGLAGNAFGGALSGGAASAKAQAQDALQADLYENQDRMNQSSFALLDRKLRDEAARRGMSFQDYMRQANFDDEIKLQLMEQEAEAQRNEATDPTNMAAEEFAKTYPELGEFDPSAWGQLQGELNERGGPHGGDDGDRREYAQAFDRLYSQARTRGFQGSARDFALNYNIPLPQASWRG